MKCPQLSIALLLIFICSFAIAEEHTAQEAISCDQVESEKKEPETVNDEVSEPVRFYITREERRDAGLKHEITPWLTLGALAEVEYVLRQDKPFGTGSDSQEDTLIETLRLVFEITPTDWSTFEVVYEYDGEFNRHVIDEAIAKFEFGHYEFELGKFFVSFGEYFNHSVTGPVLEFGETQGT